MRANFDINKEQVEAFLQNVDNTNFEIIARGNGWEGGVCPRIVKETKHYGPEKQVTEVRRVYAGRMIGGMERDYKSACNAAEGENFALACELLVNSYFYQVEIRPLESISKPAEGHQITNPLAMLIEPIVWEVEGEKVTTHGGPRRGAGRPSELGETKIINFDAPVALRDRLDAKAKERKISRAELLREIISASLEIEESEK